MRRRTTAFWKQLGALCLGILLAVVLLEGGLRVRQWWKYGTFATTQSTLSLDPISGLMVPMASTTIGALEINALGFRSPELVVPKPPGTVRVAFLGASTTFCAEVSHNAATWPHLVWQTLQTTWPQVPFDYINAGVPGYRVAQSIRNLDLRVKPLQPDVLVIYHATNDLSADTRQLAQQQGVWVGKPEDPSFLARWSITWFLLEKNLQIMARQKAASQETRRLVYDARALSAGFRQHLQDLLDAAKQVAPVVAIATFSHKFRRAQSLQEQLQAANTSLYYMPYMSLEGLMQGFEAYNAAIREAAQATGAILIDGESTIPGDARHFHDSVHFTNAGAIVMAQRVSQALLQSEVVQRWAGAGRGGPRRQ